LMSFFFDLVLLNKSLITNFDCPSSSRKISFLF